MMGKGESVIFQKLDDMKMKMQSIHQLMQSKDHTITYLRQEVANLSIPLLEDDDFGDDEKKTETTVPGTEPAPAASPKPQ